MKQKLVGGVFSKKHLGGVLSGLKMSGLTKDAAVLFATEFLAFSNKSFFLEFKNEEEAFSFYSSCAEHSGRLFVYFPPKGEGFIPGFGLENSRYRREATLRLGSNKVCCCVGTTDSFLEKSIPKNIELKTKDFIFKTGEEVEIGESIEKLISLGYSKKNVAEEPRSFSHRGDVLDIFPGHFKHPVRLSFGFEVLESITTYNPTTQLSIKGLEKLHIQDYKNNRQIVDNISLKKQNRYLKTLLVEIYKGSFSIFVDNWSDRCVFAFNIQNNTGRNPKEKAGFLVATHRETKSKFLIAKDKEKVFSFFPSGFFSGVVFGSINKSFFSKKGSFLCVSENDLFSKKTYFKKWAFGDSIRSLTSVSISTLRIGEYVVHKNFGIGIYQGIKIKKGKESVEIEYAKNTRVLVSLDQSHFLHKYVGYGKKPKVSTLGSKKWGLEVRKTTKAVELIALDVLKNISNKNNKRSFNFVKENDLDKLLSNSFSFVETPDQKKAIREVYKDMNSETPMDRLVCGDVGFGKTEVAVRAIFKSFLSDKLSVFLCPTTILADQHLLTCKKRLASFGLKIAVLSRFVSKKKQSLVLEKLKNKKIDLLIGTHRVLSKDVDLPNLGLLIIDEEHRFGVVHKEKIKTFVGATDTLTLTATPIPRTLQQSLVGLKSVSTMLSAPEMRKPILTSVRYFNWSIVFSKIEYEISRGGQVYFLSNDINSHPGLVEKIQRRFPNNSIAGASGKMPSGKLEKVVSAFFNGFVDVLVCTTIIESGLDVTNANSIVVNNSQNLGLAQLYQIRGRVGRGRKQAHCLLLVPKNELPKDAIKRLQSIEKNSNLGSGYNVSMEDLEIRGSGSVFGYKQSGHVSTVGFHLYCDLLGLEIQKNKNKSVFTQPQIKTDLQMKIEEEYIEDLSTRIDFYYKIGKASKLSSIESIQGELVDVFGALPTSTKNLLDCALVRVLYTQTPVKKINHVKNKVKLFVELVDEEKVGLFLKNIKQYKNKNLVEVHFSEDHSFFIIALSLLSSGCALDFLSSFVSVFK